MSEANEPGKIRWAILGCARISRRGLIPGIQESHRGTLELLASRRGDAARAWASEFGIPRTAGSYEAAIADPGIDAVYIPLANEEHAHYVKAAADAGKHILCEKPLALDTAEARGMVDHCRQRGVVLMEAFMWRHQPRTAGLLELVRSGGIGPLRLIRSSFSFVIDQDDWRLDPARGGGALWDVGCYGVSTARLFAGAEPVDVRGHARFGETGVDMTLAATLRFPDGVIGVIDCSFEQPFRCEYELVGTRGRIVVPDAYLPGDAPVALIYDPEGKLVEEMRFSARNQYACMVDAFAASVRAGGLVSPAEDGLAQMESLDRVLAACR